MDWLNHPSYARLRDGLVARFRRPSYTFRSVRSVIFLCGGKNSQRRDHIAGYLRKHYPDILFFYAEEAWLSIASQTRLNALQMEERLASLADMVLIIVESPGTFAELGAFSLSPNLRKKLVLILDRQYKSEASFINTGPVRWVDSDSAYGPPLFADFDIILSVMEDLETRIKDLPRARKKVAAAGELTSKQILLLACDVAAVIGPAPPSHFHYYLRKLIEGYSENTETILGLGVALGMLRSVKDGQGALLFYRKLETKEAESCLHPRMFDLGWERARFVDVLMTIEPLKPILPKVFNDS